MDQDPQDPKQTNPNLLDENYEIPGEPAELLVDGAWVKGKIIKTVEKSDGKKHHFVSTDETEISTVVHDDSPEFRRGAAMRDAELAGAAFLESRLGDASNPTSPEALLEAKDSRVPGELQGMIDVLQSLRTYAAETLHELNNGLSTDFNDVNLDKLLEELLSFRATFDGAFFHAQTAIKHAGELSERTQEVTGLLSKLEDMYGVYNSIIGAQGWMRYAVDMLEHSQNDIHENPENVRRGLSEVIGAHREDLQNALSHLSAV